jgi:hypothetical protein
MKGQSALEYLITYGWAILVILVVLAVLWYYGIFNPSKWAGEMATSGSAFQTSVVNTNLKATSLGLTLNNIAGSALTVNSITVTGDVTAASCAVGQNVSAGATITLPSCTTATTVPAGTLAKFTVSVNYNVIGGQQGKSDALEYSIKVGT